ncbi:MAG: mobile mystery protein B [Alphaproteobacteria bacterium]|nr:mobile mystery protein B [Alphaproteobacteria bacterium]OJV44980.1 MAG: mobile mystery protein B [Alphaproteobacteria bacterium 43-37]
MKFTYAEGATPLTNDEIFNLIPKHLSLQKELDEWEYINILQAEQWAFRKPYKGLLTVPFIQKLHKKMFDKTWKWAGQFRKHQTNVGIEWALIPIELQKLADDVAFQLKNKSLPIREIAVRLHHRLVFIHPFPNGNGGLSRLMADLFLESLNEPRFLWGREPLVSDSITRKKYISVLKEADKGNFINLINFAEGSSDEK